MRKILTLTLVFFTTMLLQAKGINFKKVNQYHQYKPTTGSRIGDGRDF